MMTPEQERRIMERITEMHSHLVRKIDALEAKLEGANALGDTRIGITSDSKVKQIERSREVLEKIISIVSEATGVNVSEMESMTRVRPAVLARSYVWVLAKKYIVSGFTWDALGARFGKNHVSVIHSVNTFHGRAMRSKEIRRVYELCEKNYLESTAPAVKEENKQLINN